MNQLSIFDAPQIALPPVDVRRLAADFSDIIRQWHTAEQLDGIVQANLSETDPDVDHVHDHYDANDAMAQAITRQLGRNWSWSELEREINAAWSHARAAGFAVQRVLLACEFSGTVRDEFHKLGHSAASCDVLPSDTPGEHHQRDVRELLNDGWSMMLAFPPCTYLCASGLHWNKRRPERAAKTEEALDFVRTLLDAPIDRITLENPTGCIGTRIRPADQWIQPYEYGDDASKKTGLWLKNQPLLQPDPADYVEPRMVKGKPRWGNQTDSGQNNLGPTEDRWKIRSKTFTGIARAMAIQYGGCALPA